MRRLLVLSVACLVILGMSFAPTANAETVSVLNNIIQTNDTDQVQTYSIPITVDLDLGSQNIISGSIVTSAIDGDADGAVVAAPTGMSIYDAQIDGVSIKTLQNDPFAVVTPVGATSASSAEASFGWETSDTAVNDDIGIVLNFTLTPGDTCAILSRFDIKAGAVPEPSTVMLLLMAGVGLAICARRRR